MPREHLDLVFEPPLLLLPQDFPAEFQSPQKSSSRDILLHLHAIAEK
jgi:hypothetical protein